jgi:hypothetical protein
MAATAAVFTATAFLTDEAALIIARPWHRAAIARSFRNIGFCVDALERSNRLQLLDAELTLQAVLVNQRPDPVRFGSVVEARVRSLIEAGHSRVRVYDGMGEVLAQHGPRREALAIEALWDRMTLHVSCSVLCGHSMGARPRDLTAALCTCHTHVMTADGGSHPIARIAGGLALQRASASPFPH